MLSRRLARPMLAAAFVSGGIDALRSPEPRAEMAEPVARPLAGRLGLPADPVQLVRLNGALQLGAGLLLATNRLPRLAATVLAATLVPTTLGGHRFWEVDDERAKKQQRIPAQFAVEVGRVELVVPRRRREGGGVNRRRHAPVAAGPIGGRGVGRGGGGGGGGGGAGDLLHRPSGLNRPRTLARGGPLQRYPVNSHVV